LPILFVTVVFLGIIFLFLSRPKKEGDVNWVQFYAKGKETGFSFKEIEMLRQLAIQCAIEPPIAIFESQDQLYKGIHSLVRNIKLSGESASAATRDFLSKLYDYRQKMEINKKHAHQLIAHSRQISEGQTLRVLVVGTGVFNSSVVKNTGQYMTISRPVNDKGPVTLAWTGLKIAVYFWREDDAGYVFDSEVLDEVYSLGISSLKIAHGDSLFRTQKRKSIRIKMNKAAFLYLVPSNEPAHKLETVPGVKCLLEDLSDTGYAVVIGGKTMEGFRVKAQFALNNVPVCITGTVRSTSYREDTKRTVLRIEAEPLPTNIRNQILSEVFGMMSDDDDDELPFRVVDDEAANLTGGGDFQGDDSTDSLFSANTDDDVSANVSVTMREPDEG